MWHNHSRSHPSQQLVGVIDTGLWAFLVAQMVKNLPANARDTGSIPGSGRLPLEKGMPTHSSILAWRMP